MQRDEIERARRQALWLAGAGAALACLAAALAAVGTHVLAPRLTAVALDSFRTAVDFQFFNAIGLFGAAWLRDRLPGSTLVWACGWLLFAGTVLFSGSIYAARLGLTASAGMTAPLGGSSVILAWAGLAVAAVRGRGG